MLKKLKILAKLKNFLSLWKMGFISYMSYLNKRNKDLKK